MNEIELQKQSFDMEEVADNAIVCNNETLQTTLEIIKAIRKHKNIVIGYWKTAKESAKKSYQEIVSLNIKYHPLNNSARFTIIIISYYL